MIFIVGILVAIIIVLLIYNITIHTKIQQFNNLSRQANNLKVLQDFLSTIGECSSVDEKIQKINNILIEKYEIKYSTIVVFNGAEYVLKATNVDEKFWDTMKNLHTEPIFKDSIANAIPKYVTVNKPNEKLSYQKSDMMRAKSAMFFPLYIDNIYIGYWIIEKDEPHAFDRMDTGILEIIRENIISVLKTISYQNTIENIYRTDKFTGLNSAEYLYGKGKRIIDKYGKSAICMFSINNIEEINEKIGRKVGTELIIQVANTVKINISSEYIFVRYMGPKFAIAFSGTEIENTIEFISNIKQNLENIKIVINNKKGKKITEIQPVINFVLGTYYKGTGLEEVTKKLEEYLDNSPKTESAINYI